VNGLEDGPWSATAVDDPPVLLAGPPLAYPEALRRVGAVGTVVVQAVIDTLGRAEPGSLVLQCSHAGFEAAARAYVLAAVFRPGRAYGRAVRVLVRLPIAFTLSPTP
jgi:TonB family protein